MLTFFLLVGTAPVGVAQQAPATDPKSDPASDLPHGFVDEPHVIGRAVDHADKYLGSGSSTTQKDGFYPEFGNMVTGAGWISGGPGYRHHFLDGKLMVDGSAAISWRAYKTAQARVEAPKLAGNRLTIGARVQWQDLTQVNYFGIGPDSLEDERSEFRLKETDVAGYALVRANRWLTIGGRFGWIDAPTIEEPAGPFDRGFPDTRLVFPNDPGVAEQSSMLHGGVGAEVDTRDYPSRPTRGGFYRAAWQIFSDRDLHQFSFQRSEVEGVQLLPVNERWVLGVHGWAVFSTTDSGNTVPFYMLPSIGGTNTLRGFSNYRFHDRNMLVANVESRWALFQHIDAAAFFDAGSVAARAGDLDLDKTSWGAGVRVHSRTSTLARLDVAHSTEGWKVVFNLSDPFRLARRSLRTMVIPFVP